MVAPHAGARIEITVADQIFIYDSVAPHAGARIEICVTVSSVIVRSCRSPRGSAD